jgi:effector-binding domain-containing protein
VSDGFEIVELSARPTAVVRARVPMAELPGLFDRAFHGVSAALTAQGVGIVGPPFGYYPSMPGETVEVEAGFPVAKAIESDGEVVPGELPGGRVARGMHIGPYDTLASTYAALEEWITRQGLQPGGGMWECYLTDPSSEPDPARWRTEIFCPVA